MNAVKNPMINGVIFREFVVDPVRTFKTDRTTAPEIAGIAIRNEYSAASSLSKPVRRPATNVDPERDTPGMIAIDWTRPIIKAFNFVSVFEVVFFESCSPIKKNKPVPIMLAATASGLEKI